MSNPLTDVLPAKVRKYAYAAYAVAVAVTGVWAVLGHVPDQVTAIETAIGGALGVVAGANVHKKGPRV